MALEGGGFADKFGNSYEAIWVAKQLLRLAEEKIHSIIVEPLGDDETDDKTSSAGDLNNNDSSLCNLTEDQQALYKLFLRGERFSRAEVQEHFQWREDKAGNELRALKSSQLITALGSGSKTTYRKK